MNLFRITNIKTEIRIPTVKYRGSIKVKNEENIFIITQLRTEKIYITANYKHKVKM